MTTIENELELLRREGQFRSLSLPQGVSFSHNDYLGLSQHPSILRAGHQALDIYGAGSTGSRLLGGHLSIFEKVEERIAEFFGSPTALFFSSGYLANLAVTGALGKTVDHIFSDELNHASLIDGIRLTGLPKTRVPHRMWENVEFPTSFLAVTESLFSMDGDIAPLELLQEKVAQKNGWLLVDEAHAAGVFREKGQGLGKYDWDHTCVTVTFGKAFGVSGAAVLCHESMREWIINSSRSFIYTTAPSPVVAAMVLESLNVVEEESWRRGELWDRARAVRNILSEVGQGIASGEWESRVPIIPFFVPGQDNALRFSESMRESGMELRAIRYPTVAKGSERIRISLNLTASRDNTEEMAREMVRRWKEFS